MNFTLITVGIIFLLNPMWGIYDILPDTVGAIMLISGLYKVYFGTEKLKKAIVYVSILGGIEAVRIALAPSWLTLDGSTQLLVCFFLTLAEAILLLSFGSSVTDGVNELTLIHSKEKTSNTENYSLNKERVEAKLGKSEKEKAAKRNKYDVYRYKTPFLVYSCARIVAFLLPELVELIITEDRSELLKTGFYGILTLIFLVPFILMTVRSVKTFLPYKKDKIMIQGAVEAADKARRNDPLLFARGRARVAKVLLMIGSIFSLYIFIDYSDVVPKIGAAFFFAVLAIFGAKAKGLKIATCVVSVGLVALNYVYHLKNNAYFLDYEIESAGVFESAKAQYNQMIPWAISEALCLFVLIVLGLSIYKRIKEDEILLRDDHFGGFVKGMIRKNTLYIAAAGVLAFALCVLAAVCVPVRLSLPQINVALLIADFIFLGMVYSI